MVCISPPEWMLWSMGGFGQSLTLCHCFDRPIFFSAVSTESCIAKHHRCFLIWQYPVKMDIAKRSSFLRSFKYLFTVPMLGWVRISPTKQETSVSSQNFLTYLRNNLNCGYRFGMSVFFSVAFALSMALYLAHLTFLFLTLCVRDLGHQILLFWSKLETSTSWRILLNLSDT